MAIYVKILLYISITILCSQQAFSQFKIKDSCGTFSLKITAKNLPSDTIKLLYSDCDKSQDTIILLNGKGSITGKINRASEAILFTDIKSGWFDSPGAIRFIIEPNNMNLRFTMINDTARNVKIEGSRSENQKIAWESEHDALIVARDKNESELEELLSQKRIMDSLKFKNRLEVIGKKRDSLKNLLLRQALIYVKQNPHSYFSGYLLNHFKQTIIADTLKKYFCLLDSNVIYSDLGKRILEELFRVTNDWNFRKNFSNSVTYEFLKRTKNIYDVSLPDADGKETRFSKFRGNLLLIDFWASWCAPCIRNAPYLKKLATEFKNTSVKIISVSVDDSRYTWKKAIKKYDFPGIHFLDEQGLLSTFYKILWVPHYVIVNTDGSVADANAPQAMDTRLKDEIEQLLKSRLVLKK